MAHYISQIHVACSEASLIFGLLMCKITYIPLKIKQFHRIEYYCVCYNIYYYTRIINEPNYF